MNNRSKPQRLPLCDDKIIELYWERNEQAIDETDFKYKNYLFAIAYNMVSDNRDCEECLNDTYIGAWNTMPPTRPAVLKAFLTTIIRRAAIKRYHHNLKKSSVPSEMTVALSELEGCFHSDEDVEASFDAKALGTMLTRFARALPERKQFVFLSRYYMGDSINKIAELLKVSTSTVNKELSAIRCKLLKALEQEGYLL